MIHPPKFNYCGLTVILEKPSRFDNKRLISGNAGDWFDMVLSPLTRFNLDIRTADEAMPLDPNTRVILALGQGALDKYAPGKSLLTYRGSPLTHGSQIVIPSVTVQDTHDRKNYENPEDDDDEEDETDDAAEKDRSKTRRKNFKFWLHQDTKKAIRIGQFGIRNYPTPTVINSAPASNICDVLKRVKGGLLVLDIETDKYQNITCFSFLWTDRDVISLEVNYEVYIIPFKTYQGNIFYSREEYCEIFAALSTAFRDNLVVGHNIGFDLFVLLSKYHIPPPKNTFDTMIAHHRLHPEIEKSLAHCISLYTDLPYHKDEGVFDPKNWADEQKLQKYNAKDVITTYFIYCGLLPQLRKDHAYESALQGCAAIRSCLTMQYEGMPVDKDKFVSTVVDGDRRVEQFKQILSIMTKRDFNPNSSKQVCKYLFDDLKLKRPLKNPTNEKQLLKIYVKHPYPSIRLILYTRGVKKTASALRKVVLWREGRMTTLYKITGTDTFRLASTALLKFKSQRGYGTNVQNFSKELRKIIVAPPGYTLWNVDQAGAEALIVAYLCKNARFRSLFLNKIKPHTFVAMHIAPKHWANVLGVGDIDEYLNSQIPNLKTLKYWSDLSKAITESDSAPNPKDRYYYIGKQCCHLLNFDATWAMFQLTALVKSEGSLAFTDDEAKYYRNLYRDKLFPEITYYHVDINHRLQAQGRVLYNFFGFPRKFTGPWDSDLQKQCYAFVPQSTVGCLTVIAQTEVSKRIEDKDPIFDKTSILQNGHDSLLGMSPDELVDGVITEVTKHMRRELVNYDGEKFTMGSGAGKGKNWGGYHKDKNPLGMKE